LIVMKKRILLFSTLSPYPFWAGSEKYWFDFVTNERVSSSFDFHIRLADSPVTREKAGLAAKSGAVSSFYRHFNVDFARRNLARLKEKVSRKGLRVLPWYDEIRRQRPDLVWFSADGLHNLRELAYGTAICRELGIPYWIVLQHGYEDFFLADNQEIEIVTEIVVSAKRFVFIADRNRQSLERAIGRRLDNALHSVNTLSKDEMRRADRIAEASPVINSETARFFNLGRFSPESKGQHLLLEAFAGSEWKDRDWSLSFIGISDTGRSYLERLIGFFGLDRARIEIVPFTGEPFTEIARRDVLLMPSLAEGTPYAMIESMACGRPAMGTPVGGIPELIKDGKNGWLARTTDVSDIAQAVERAWAARSGWGSFGEAARAFVSTNHCSKKAVEELLSVLAADTSTSEGERPNKRKAINW